MAIILKRIYITYTPFHLLTACGLASQKDDDTEKILVFIKDFPNSDVYHQAIQEWKNNPFKDIVIVDVGTQLEQETMTQRFGFSRAKYNVVKRYWKEHLKDDASGYEVYSFNDDTVEAQFLYRKNERDRNYYLDDGLMSYSYNPSTKNIKFYVKAIIRKLLFGFWVERPYPLGTSKHVSKVLSYFPDHVVEQLKKKSLVQIPQTIFDSLENKGFINIIKERFGLSDIEDEGPTGVLLFPLFYTLKSLRFDTTAFARVLFDYFNSRDEKFKRIFLKCHPREPESTGEKIRDTFPQVTLVKNSIAAEILFILMRTAIKHKILIIAPQTTAFLNARAIFGDSAEIICIEDIQKITPSVQALFNDLNIIVRAFAKDLEKVGVPS